MGGWGPSKCSHEHATPKNDARAVPRLLQSSSRAGQLPPAQNAASLPTPTAWPAAPAADTGGAGDVVAVAQDALDPGPLPRHGDVQAGLLQPGLQPRPLLPQVLGRPPAGDLPHPGTPLGVKQRVRKRRRQPQREVPGTGHLRRDQRPRQPTRPAPVRWFLCTAAQTALWRGAQ